MKRSTGFVAAFLAYFIWGLLPVFWKLLRAVPSDRIIAHRVLWSFLFVLLILLFLKKRTGLAAVLRQPRQMLILALAAVLCTANWLIYIYSVNSGQIVESSLGYYINPLVSIALGAVFFKEKFRTSQIIAIGLAAAGVAVMAFSIGRLPWISLALALTFGTYGLLKKKAAVDSTVGLAIETGLMTPLAIGYLLLAPASGLIPVNTATAPVGLLAAGSPLLPVLLPLAGVVTATPLLLFATGTRHLDLSMMGFLQYQTPTLMLLLGVLAYHETFTATHAVCFGLIWSGLILYTISKMREAKVLHIKVQGEDTACSTSQE